jgi:hypothetical protein
MFRLGVFIESVHPHVPGNTLVILGRPLLMSAPFLITESFTLKEMC